jgi:hypothetical protein
MGVDQRAMEARFAEAGDFGPMGNDPRGVVSIIPRPAKRSEGRQ